MAFGFTYYNSKPAPVESTTAEIVASLTNDQKVAVLNGFAKKVLPKRLKYQTDVPEGVIVHLYRKIDDIEETARILMRGELVITPAEYNEFGEETSPAVYNTPPSTSTQLKNQVKDAFADDFTEAQVIAILTKMVEYSKYDGSGDWTFYKDNVII